MTWKSLSCRLSCPHVPWELGINQISSPLSSKNEPCKYKPEYSAANVTGFHGIPAQEKDLEFTVANVGPISVSIDASKQTFQFYKEGKHLSM